MHGAGAQATVETVIAPAASANWPCRQVSFTARRNKKDSPLQRSFNCSQLHHAFLVLREKEQVGPFLAQHGFQIEDVANLDCFAVGEALLYKRIWGRSH